MRYMLDTNICIYSIKHKPKQVFLKLQEHDPEDICILGSKLTKSKVESKLRQGKDVITYYKSDALNIANSVGSTRSKCDPKHRGSASFKHYHVKYKNIKLSIHSFYV